MQHSDSDTVESILTTLVRNIDNGRDQRLAEPGEIEALAERDGMHVVGRPRLVIPRDDDGEKIGPPCIVGEQLHRAMTWPGFKKKQPLELRCAVTAKVIHEQQTAEGMTTDPLDDDVQKCLETLRGLDVAAFIAHLDEKRVQWRNVDVEDCLVTLDQAAAVCSTSKRTLERFKEDGRIPEPDYPGGGGKANRWRWSNLRPALEDHVRPGLPERFPASRIV